MERDELQTKILKLYDDERDALGESGTNDHLERGKQWDLSGTLSAGGVLVFPHIMIQDCGYQVAACVHAALDSGADKVIVLSVLHAFTQEMEDARVAVVNGEDPSKFKFWGIQGTGIDGREEWKGDHALIGWRHFWDAEVKRRGLTEATAPKVYERYPYIAGGKPENLPGIDDLAKLMEDAVVVTTADSFHHGIGYGDSPEEAYDHDEEGMGYAKSMLNEGISILEKADYLEYQQHCLKAKSDARDTGQVYRHLRGEMTGEILDLCYSDSTGLYNQPPPTWVAGALIEWKPVK